MTRVYEQKNMIEFLFRMRFKQKRKRKKINEEMKKEKLLKKV